MWQSVPGSRGVRAAVDVVLRRRRVDDAVYVLVATACTVVPAVALGTLLYAAAAAAGRAPESFPVPGSYAEMLVDAAGYVVLAPLMETAILIAIVGLVRGVTSRPLWVVGVPSLLWGLAHGVFTSGWIDFGGRVAATTWAFAVFTTVYLAWRGEGRGRGFWMATAVHALNNLVAVVFLAASLLL